MSLTEIGEGLLILDSLFPVVELLPGLTRDKSSGLYYLQGKIEDSDRESLYKYTPRIGELTLGDEPDSEPRLAPHVLARIAQLQYPNEPLFPSLHRLRIVETSTYLNLLHVLLSPSLTTLEMTEISVDEHFSSVLSFLECAIHQAPQLSTLILGPGVIDDQFLNVSWRYQNLRRLELVEVEISITDQLLQGIGSLQHLETFVLQDDGDSTYQRSASSAIGEQALAPGSPNSISNCRAEAEADITLSQSPSVSRCASPESTLSVAENGPTNVAGVEGATVGSALFPALRSLEVGGSLSLIEDLVAKVSSSDLRTLSVDFTESLKRTRIQTSTKALPTAEEPQADLLPEQKSEVIRLIRHSIQRWIKTLVAVTFTNNHTTVVSFPCDVFEHLLLIPNMKKLEITGMDIDNMTTTLCLSCTVAGSKLEALHLPIHSTSPGIHLKLLRRIARWCPRLESFRCRFEHLSLSIPQVLSPLSHQLKQLSVVNQRAHPKQQRLVEIARYLDATFPNLKTIQTFEGHGNNAEQWDFIFVLVNLCRDVRMDEHQRLQLVQGGCP